MFKTQRSRIQMSVWIILLLIVFGIPAITGFVMRSMDVFLSGVIYMGLAAFVLGVLFCAVAWSIMWITKAPGIEKEDKDLGEVISSSAKKPEGMPAATLIGILEMWPGSAEVWIQSVHSKEMNKVQDLSYDRDYHRIIIREVEE